MRTLTNTEIEFAAGGNGAAIITGVLLTTIAFSAIISSLSSSTYSYVNNCKWEPYVKEVRTPVYDAYGTHVYDNVDSYKDYQWVCA
jgi:hypothetical protein